MKRLLLLLLLVAPSFAQALPMYAMRSGRTCGNCHVSPTYEDEGGWPNPELMKRKCNMSCMVCHTNPAGGGLRNTSGRYYGQSTLSIFPYQERSYSDYGRELASQEDIRSLLNKLGSWPFGKEEGRQIPSTFAEVQSGIGANQRGGWSNFGKPFLGPSEYAFWDGRYGDLNADPLLQFGGDFRFAYWSGSQTFFPMQLDLHASVHPVEHLTVMATAAARGRTSGPNALIAQEQLPVFARNAFVMVHELPFMAYAKGGIFMPNFGTYIDDHTSFIREDFEMDVSTSDDTVIGAEIGLAPNYPFANFSAFRNFRPYGVAEDVDPGWGLTANLGWRDLGWSLTASGMMKRRPLEARGDLDALALGVGFNPFYYSNSIPLTYMGELVIGRRQRPITGTKALTFAMYHELWWTIVNGLSARFKYDLGARDAELDQALDHRVSAALDVSPVPGVTLITQGRMLVSQRDDQPGWDVFIHTHLWF